MKFKSVTQAEFQEFVKTYPRNLVFDVAGMYEPPLVTFSDFTVAPEWPGSVVARYRLAWYEPAGNYEVREDLPQ